MTSEMRMQFSRTLHTSKKKRTCSFVGEFMRFSQRGADGWDNTKRSCKLNYETPRDASCRSSDADDARRNLRNRRTTRARTAFSSHLNYCVRDLPSQRPARNLSHVFWLERAVTYH